MINRLRNNGRLAALVGFTALAASACGPMPLNTMNSAGRKAAEINELGLWLFGVSGVVFVAVHVLLWYMFTKFRAKAPESAADERPGGYADDDFPAQIHGHDAAEWTWTAVPFLLLVVVSVFTVIAVFKQDDVRASGNPMVVEVVGQQWWWEFQYHLDGNLDTPPDVVTANEMIIPVGIDVPLEVQSRDVIHSFWIPRLNGKKDAVPGRSHPWVIQANEIGRFAGQCTEFCGLSHAYMQMFTVAVTAEEFDAWIADQTQTAAVYDAGDEFFEGQQLFVQQCSECHIINGVTDRDGDDSNGVDGLDIYTPGNGFDDKYTDSITAGAAPNLTHLMSRETFAGSFFDLYDENGDVNRAELDAWVFNAPEQKPNRPDNLQGMRAFTNLDPDQLDAIVDYLETLQ